MMESSSFVIEDSSDDIIQKGRSNTNTAYGTCDDVTMIPSSTEEEDDEMVTPKSLAKEIPLRTRAPSSSMAKPIVKQHDERNAKITPFATSTPLLSNGTRRIPYDIDVTAINEDEDEEEEDEGKKKRDKPTTSNPFANQKTNVHGQDFKPFGNKFTHLGGKENKLTNKPKQSLLNDPYDDITKHVEKLTIDKTKKFDFKKPSSAPKFNFEPVKSDSSSSIDDEDFFSINGDDSIEPERLESPEVIDLGDTPKKPSIPRNDQQQTIHDTDRTKQKQSNEEVVELAEEEEDDDEDIQEVIPAPVFQEPRKIPSAEVLAYRSDVKKAINHLVEVVQTIPKEGSRTTSPRGLKIELYDYQQYGLEWLSWREAHYPGGGILADEMGLGKTIMIMALILRGKEKLATYGALAAENSWISTCDKSKLVPSRATLIIVPLSVINQWAEEMKSKAHRLNVHIFHGPKRTSSSAVLSQNDVVLTTYSTVSSEIKDPKNKLVKPSKSPLQRVYWERIVLDEGHVIRNAGTNTAFAVSKLQAAFRWAVTGTPVHNKPSDLHSLVKFLHMKPFDDEKVWDYWIGLKTVPPENMDRLKTISKSLILRRTKEEVNVGDDADRIPPKLVEDVILELSEQEKQVYDMMNQYAEAQFRKFLKNRAEKKLAGKYLVGGKNYQGGEINFSHIFALLIRLRQLSVLPYLASQVLEDADEDVSSEFDPTNHNDILSFKNPIFDEYYNSSKLIQLFSDLHELRKKFEDTGVKEKVVIVSQWTSLLRVVGKRLPEFGYSFATISGEVSVADRTEVMSNFNKSKRPEVLLLSLAAGGVGLNLTGGNHMFFLDLHYNPQLEIQAQGRIHRVGQVKNCFIKRYVCKDTVEERIITMQKEKITLADGVLSSAKSKAHAGLNIEDMKKLFGF